ncbi:MAG: nitronate monooxygenase [Candidatus Pseudothioglobus sp.]|jgi:nitronate monooxygenase|nr:nitronate monooxygenase [Candidatus Thioglobus sp.]
MENKNFIKKLRLPIIQSPMFIVSNARLVIASSKAGIVGSFPTANCRTLEALDESFSEITAALGTGKDALPWSVNIIVSKMYARSNDDLDLILKYKPPIVITSLGNPKEVVEKVHEYGGLVFSDVINLYHSKKAISVGVDGLILICNGAGGHTGDLSPFAFVSEVREIFDGIIIVGGSISSGDSILAIQALGADMAYMGTRFIATQESDATDEYKEMILNATASEIVKSNKITGVNGNWLEQSLKNAGISTKDGGFKKTLSDLKRMIMPLIKQKLKVDFDISKVTAKRWRDIFSAGQGVGSISNVPSVEDLVIELEQQHTKSKSRIL